MNRSKVVPLYQGEDESKLDELWIAAQNADEQASKAAAGPKRMLAADSTIAAEARDAFNDYLTEARARAVLVTVNALDRKDWRALTKAHPARDNNMDDVRVGGYNEDEFPDALLEFKGTITEIVNSEIQDVDLFLRRLSDGEFQTLYNAAYTLNTGLAIDPKALPVSGPTPTSDEK